MGPTMVRMGNRQDRAPTGSYAAGVVLGVRPAGLQDPGLTLHTSGLGPWSLSVQRGGWGWAVALPSRLGGEADEGPGAAARPGWHLQGHCLVDTAERIQTTAPLLSPPPAPAPVPSLAGDVEAENPPWPPPWPPAPLPASPVSRAGCWASRGAPDVSGLPAPWALTPGPRPWRSSASQFPLLPLRVQVTTEEWGEAAPPTSGLASRARGRQTSPLRPHGRRGDHLLTPTST